ncbi:MAG: adenylate/guanylate cyclase domain-containing protein [Acidobacteriota bacterium]|nr:adenylate/guanylate cyclase domain-containing protein [Acidobacteriota bacterium]
MRRTPIHPSKGLPMWPFAVGLLLLYAAFLPLAPRLDRGAFDALSQHLRTREDPHPVVLIGIDEATERAYPEPHALWHRHLGAVLEALAVAGPRVVGVDVTLPDRSFDAVLPGGDAALLKGLVLLRHRCPLVLGATVEGNGAPRPIYPPFRSAVGEGGLGLVEWPVDPDGVVRRFMERFPGQSAAVPTLTGQMARALGRPVDSGWLDYRQAAPVPYVPFHEVETAYRAGRLDVLRGWFSGKVVLIGSVLPFVDRHYQVVDLNGWGEDNRGFAPGVLLHVQALRNLMGSGFIHPVPLPLSLLLGLALTFLGAWAGRRVQAGALVVAGVAILGGAAAGLAFRHHAFLPPTLPLAGLALGYAARVARDTLARQREATRLRRVFGGYVSPSVLAEILAGRIDPNLAGERAFLCVLFSDVRGFTTLSEGREPEVVIQVLNRYFDRMAPRIHAFGGAVDAYMGDGIMAHFGHPEGLENPCQAAFDASRAMLRELEGLNAELRAEGLPELRIGIGLHAGEAVVGHIGSKERHEYTAIGDTVNVASRIEGLTKEAGYPLLATEPVARRLLEPLVSLGPKPIKGHSPLPVFGWSPSEAL